MAQTPPKATFRLPPDSKHVPPEARAGWTVLDTRFEGGEGLLRAAQDWMQDPGPIGVLHYVALCDVADLPRWRSKNLSAEISPPLAEELSAACSTALPGIQRMLLQGGHISLTLCAGPVQAMLSEQLFRADEVRLVLSVDAATQTTEWDKWAVQLLARRCRRGTLLQCSVVGKPEHPAEHPGIGAVHQHLADQGFVWTQTAHDTAPKIARQAHYNPRWELRTTRTPERTSATAVGHCAVVGAGLAGASVAHALALRGWQVTVLDTHAQAARGASGLPAGLLVPHVSVDDSPRSRMSRAGVRLTLAHAQRLLQRGTDWDATGVMEFSTEASRCLAASAQLQAAGWLAPGNTTQGLWHPHAAWIKPAQLVEAWLSHPNIRWMGSCDVSRLERRNANWALLNAHGETLTTAATVVVANAGGVSALLQGLAPDWAMPAEVLRKLQLLQSLHGTVSHGAMPAITDPDPFPRFPVNGNGSLMGNIPTRYGPRWYAGATYETSHPAASNPQTQHTENLQRLQALLPSVARALSAQFSDEQVGCWTGTRCVSHDRLPLVGPVHADGKSGLWLSLAMGSRGLSFAALCAEWLVARIGQEPLPMEARLLRSFDVHRPLRR